MCLCSVACAAPALTDNYMRGQRAFCKNFKTIKEKMPRLGAIMSDRRIFATTNKMGIKIV